MTTFKRKNEYELEAVYTTPFSRDIKIHRETIYATSINEALFEIKDEVIYKTINKNLPTLCNAYSIDIDSFTYDKLYNIVKKYITFISFEQYADNFTTFVNEYHD